MANTGPAAMAPVATTSPSRVVALARPLAADRTRPATLGSEGVR
jgi:hypothetical protein